MMMEPKGKKVAKANSQSATTTPAPGSAVVPTEEPALTRQQMIVNMAMEPLVRSVQTACTFAQASYGELPLLDAVVSSRQQVRKVADGDLSSVETMLYGQATALNSIFNELARRAALNMGEHLQATDMYLRQALKAQGQCRATLETLAEIKNPRHVTFAKQANIANGPQQVNNGAPPAMDTPARTETSASPTNEL